MTVREQLLVELVTAEGAPVGSATVAAAHADPGVLHRAFSVLLFDPEGRVLLQRRASVKTRFPLRWANTCCGHPGPGENLITAASRRLVEEIGLRSVSLTEVGVYAYTASDPGTGMVEREYDHVLTGQLDRTPDRLAIDPAEVAEVKWISPRDLAADLAINPSAYAPWLSGVLAVATR